jgi:hypothetical protein
MIFLPCDCEIFSKSGGVAIKANITLAVFTIYQLYCEFFDAFCYKNLMCRITGADRRLLKCNMIGEWQVLNACADCIFILDLIPKMTLVASFWWVLSGLTLTKSACQLRNSPQLGSINFTVLISSRKE